MDDLKIKQKDVDYLTKEEKSLADTIENNPEDKQNIYKKDELAKLRAKLFKRQVELRKIQENLGKSGEKLIDKWKKGLKSMTTIKKTVENEKENQEKKAANETVNKELKTKFAEIKEAKKLLLITSFFEGNDKEELTKSEIEKFGREDTPVEKYDVVKDNVNNLEEEYLEIAKKLGIEKEIQSKIKLLTDDVDRIKSVKSATESDRRKKDDVLESKDKAKKKISDNYLNSRDPKKDKEIPPKEQKRIDDLTAEQEPLRADIGKLKLTIARVTSKKELYEKLINDLKKIKKEDEFRTRMEKFETEFTALTEKYKNIEPTPIKEYSQDEIDAEIDAIIEKENERLAEDKKLTDEEMAAKKKDSEYTKRAKNNLDKADTIEAEAVAAEVADTTAAADTTVAADTTAAADTRAEGGRSISRKRHNTRRHKRTKPKKTIRK